MKMKQLAMLAALLLPMTASAADNGMQDGMADGMPRQGVSSQMFMKKVEVDGYMVSFHVMPASEGMQHGGSSDHSAGMPNGTVPDRPQGEGQDAPSHNFMVKVEKAGAVQPLMAVNSKVIDPAGKAVSQMMMKMGDWYMAGYDLDQPGRYQLMVLFKTEDGAKHFGGVYYPQEK